AAGVGGVGGYLHQGGDVTAPKLHVEAGQEGTDHRLRVDLAATDGIEDEGLGRVAGDQGPVEVEVGADLGAFGAGLDLAQQCVQVLFGTGHHEPSSAVVRSREAT